MSWLKSLKLYHEVSFMEKFNYYVQLLLKKLLLINYQELILIVANIRY
jgi:hypothetical protein